MSKKERILYALKQVGVENINQFGEDHGSKMYAKLYRQLFSQQDYGVTLEVVEYVLERYPNISAYYIISGEGPWERTKIVTPPTHRQDIHIEGGTAAISQSGSATVEPDEPIGQESLTALIEEKDKIIASLQHDLAVLKEAIRVLASK